MDSEIEIGIRQVEISPSHENRLLDPPYPRTSFFEVEIDQIQKNGKTVFSLRNICPVQIQEKTGLNFLNSLIIPGSSRIIKRFQSQEGETETRWLYTDDFFLISLSSGDRHDLDMLVSLVIGKLNTIALSIQTGKRIHSEFENQEKFRTVMSTMFSEGVDGAFRDVPVYQQHGDMTDSDIDVSAALMSAEFQDLMTVCASEEGAVSKIPVVESTRIGAIVEGNCPAEGTLTESTDAEPATYVSIPEVNSPECGTRRSTMVESVPEESTQTDIIAESTGQAESVPEENTQTDIIAESTGRAESVPEESTQTDIIAESTGQAESVPEKNTQTDIIAESTGRAESVPKFRCSSCDAKISATTKFCGNCGAAVSITPPHESTPDFPVIPANSGGESYPVRSQPAAESAVNLKSIKELEDLSWLSD
ncbi:MAG: zinc ribbon domain-containing protein [Methanoregula sp.]